MTQIVLTEHVKNLIKVLDQTNDVINEIAILSIQLPDAAKVHAQTAIAELEAAAEAFEEEIKHNLYINLLEQREKDFSKSNLQE